MVEKQVRHVHHKETLFVKKQLWHRMNILRSEGHEIYGMHVNKIPLLPFDTKRWVLNGVHIVAYRHKNIKERHLQAEAVYLAAQLRALHR